MDHPRRGDDDLVEELIRRFQVASVTSREALRTHDYIVRLDPSGNERIDREGPAYGHTAARFRLQIGHRTLAGIQMQVDEGFDINFVREAFRRSYRERVYIHITKRDA